MENTRTRKAEAIRSNALPTTGRHVRRHSGRYTDWHAGRQTAAILATLFALAASPAFGVESPRPGGAETLVNWKLLWTGSWYKSLKSSDDLAPEEKLFSGGTLYNRGNLSLGLIKPDLSFRFLATDKRLLPPVEDDGKAGFHPGAGVYHNGSGSRFIYGVQSEYGLPARTSNVWLRSIPFMENRGPSSRDLKAEPAAQDRSESYLYLSLPANLLPGFDAFGAVALDADRNPAFGGGVALGGREANLRMEAFYTRKELPPKTISTWFSPSPPLPARDFEFYTVGMIFNSGPAAFAADLAFSETFAWGRGIYGNAALRLGNKPWRFSLAGDGAGTRFVDRRGTSAGAGFRLAAKAERFRPRSGLLRFQGSLRSPGYEESFNRGAFSVYFRPSAPSAAEKRRSPYLFRLSRTSISFSRDARTPEKTADSLDALAGFYLGPFSPVFSASLHSLSAIGEKNEAISLFHFPLFENFDSFKFSGELGWNPGIFNARAKLGRTIFAKKDSVWDLSMNLSVRPGKWGRLSLNIASSDFPEKWNYTLGWRLEYGGKR